MTKARNFKDYLASLPESEQRKIEEGVKRLMTHEELKKKILENPEAKAEYDRLAPEYEALRFDLIASQTDAFFAVLDNAGDEPPIAGDELPEGYTRRKRKRAE